MQYLYEQLFSFFYFLNNKKKEMLNFMLILEKKIFCFTFLNILILLILLISFLKVDFDSIFYFLSIFLLKNLLNILHQQIQYINNILHLFHNKDHRIESH